MVEKSKKVLDKKDTKVKKISNNKKRVKKEIKTEEPKKEKLILDEEFINNINSSCSIHKKSLSNTIYFII